jgi:hypothetical protein
MKTKIITLTALVSILGGVSLLAATPSQTTSAQVSTTSAQFQMLAFKDKPEADMLHRAYRILAHGDHDYAGHRAKAMEQVHKAADMLGLDLTGDDKDHEKQVLSDDKLREARGLLQNVLGTAEVKDQKRISRHIDEAIKEIDIALDKR